MSHPKEKMLSSHELIAWKSHLIAWNHRMKVTSHRMKSSHEKHISSHESISKVIAWFFGFISSHKFCHRMNSSHRMNYYEVWEFFEPLFWTMTSYHFRPKYVSITRGLTPWMRIKIQKSFFSMIMCLLKSTTVNFDTNNFNQLSSKAYITGNHWTYTLLWKFWINKGG